MDRWMVTLLVAAVLTGAGCGTTHVNAAPDWNADPTAHLAGQWPQKWTWVHIGDTRAQVYQAMGLPTYSDNTGAKWQAYQYNYIVTWDTNHIVTDAWDGRSRTSSK